MALPILDGNQSATTLSSILTSGEHIPAHTVVSLGTQAITDMRGAVSGSVVSISNFPATQPVSIASVTIGNTVTIAGTVTANPTGTQTIAGTVTANLANVVTTDLYSVSSAIKVTGADGGGVLLGGINSVGVPENVYEGGAIPVRGAVGIDVPISGTVTANLDSNSPVIASQVETGIAGYAADSANDPFPISGTVTANTFALQGTAVTTSDFTSTTASTLLAGYNATREVLTIFNEGAGNLHICAGATCTTIAYQVRLSAGDYYEVPNHQTTITHSAVFATAGTARVTEVS